MSIDFSRLREQIQIEELLHWMSWNPTHRRGDQLRGPCPLCQPADDGFSPLGHRSHEQCFSVNTRRNIFRCFRCNRSGNALELWALYRRVGIYPAACEIQNRLALASESYITQPTKASRPTTKHATTQPATPPKRLTS